MSSELSRYITTSDPLIRQKMRLAIYEKILVLKPLYDSLSKQSHYGTLQENGIRGQTKPERMFRDAEGKDVFVHDIEPSRYPHFVNAEHYQLCLDCILPESNMSDSFVGGDVSLLSPYARLENFVIALIKPDDGDTSPIKVLGDPFEFAKTKQRVTSLIVAIASDYLNLTEPHARDAALTSLLQIFPAEEAVVHDEGKEEISKSQKLKEDLKNHLRNGLLEGIVQLIDQKLEESRNFAASLLAINPDDDDSFIVDTYNLYQSIIVFRENTTHLMNLLQRSGVDEESIKILGARIGDLDLHSQITYLCAHTMARQNILILPTSIPKDSEFYFGVSFALHKGTLGDRSNPIIELRQAHLKVEDLNVQMRDQRISFAQELDRVTQASRLEVSNAKHKLLEKEARHEQSLADLEQHSILIRTDALRVNCELGDAKRQLSEIDSTLRSSREAHDDLVRQHNTNVEKLKTIRDYSRDSHNKHACKIPLDIIFLFTAAIGIAAIALAFTVLSAGIHASIAVTVAGGLVCAFSVFGMRQAGYNKGVANQAKEMEELLPTQEVRNQV
ncbi:MAG: hypothetical protein P1U74_03840 [Legionellaceae bacterium]|nr:hypothetical protein [Legionellaceae bacterium]